MKADQNKSDFWLLIKALSIIFIERNKDGNGKRKVVEGI